MWVYQQSTGKLFHEEDSSAVEVACGYSGAGECKNNPASQHIHNKGPLPQGSYKIGEPHDTQEHGPYVLPLFPHMDNTMFGRGGFLIHGDSLAAPGTASEGCIILPRKVREYVWASGDRYLEVKE